MSYVYVIGAQRGPRKIGVSSCPDFRVVSLQTSNARKLRVLFEWLAADEWTALKVELTAHRLLDEKRLEGEWFAVSTTEAIETVKQAVTHVQQGLPVPRKKRTQRPRPVYKQFNLQDLLADIEREFGKGALEAELAAMA